MKKENKNKNIGFPADNGSLIHARIPHSRHWLQIYQDRTIQNNADFNVL